MKSSSTAVWVDNQRPTSRPEQIKYDTGVQTTEMAPLMEPFWNHSQVQFLRHII